MVRRSPPNLRRDLIEAAILLLEEEGPDVLQARTVTAAVETSTQAVYTVFGGMPGLLDAVVAYGFREFAEQMAAVLETDDPVADHLSKCWAFCDWAALTHPQLYRLMFGLTGEGIRPRATMAVNLEGAMAQFPEGEVALGVLMRSVTRMIDSGRIRGADSLVVAGQFLSATHGYVLLQGRGSFGSPDSGIEVMAQLALNLMVGLGDDRAAAERSLHSADLVRFAL